MSRNWIGFILLVGGVAIGAFAHDKLAARQQVYQSGFQTREVYLPAPPSPPMPPSDTDLNGMVGVPDEFINDMRAHAKRGKDLLIYPGDGDGDWKIRWEDSAKLGA